VVDSVALAVNGAATVPVGERRTKNDEMVTRTMKHPSSYRSKYGIIHVMGPQCGEPAEAIIIRKAKDFAVRNAGKTLWAHHSKRAEIGMVRHMCGLGPAYLYLVADSVGVARKIKMPGQDTKDPPRAAREYHSRDREHGGWRPINGLGISDVLDGHRYLDKENGWALVLGPLENLMSNPLPIAMEDWADITGETPMTLKTGYPRGRVPGHAVCAEQMDMSSNPDVWIKERAIIGIAPLVPPYAMYLR
jgi:hypothetical protein